MDRAPPYPYHHCADIWSLDDRRVCTSNVCVAKNVSLAIILVSTWEDKFLYGPSPNVVVLVTFKAYWSRDAPPVQHSTTVRSAHTVFMCFVFI